MLTFRVEALGPVADVISQCATESYTTRLGVKLVFVLHFPVPKKGGKSTPNRWGVSALPPPSPTHPNEVGMLDGRLGS